MITCSINPKTTKLNNSFILIKINFRILILFILSSCISNDDSFIPGQTETGNQTNYPEIQYGLNDYDIVFQGINRYFNIYVPQNYQHEFSTSLLFVFHGFGGTSDYIMNTSNFNDISDRENFIVVYPQGSSFWGYPHWNVGGWTNSSSADDIGFTSLLIELISEQYNINQNRIYATGMSNGGFFSYLLACQLSEKFAAVASVTGSMTNETFNQCNPQKEIPILQIHGTLDPIVIYDGNSSIGSIGINQVLDYWKSNNECNDAIVVDTIDSDLNDNLSVTELLFDGGLNGSVVSHFKVSGGGHTWFMNNDINSSEIVWEFFSKYDLNGSIN